VKDVGAGGVVWSAQPAHFDQALVKMTRRRRCGIERRAARRRQIRQTR